MITYSKAKIDDLDAISELYISAFLPLFEKIGVSVPSKEVMKDVFELYLDSGIILVTKDEDKIIGFMCGVKSMREPLKKLFSFKWFLKSWKFIFTRRTRFISPPKLRSFIGSHLIAEAVHKDYRRRGIAEKLARMTIEELENQGAKSFHFETLYDNIPIIGLYEKIGFQKDKVFRAHGVDWQIMKKIS